MSAGDGPRRPRQGWAGLVNISFGFFGIQIGFALQNANMSRIFQSLGTELDDLPILWIAAPLTGLLVQPLVGYCSDRTWLGRLGRRRPYFLGGAILAMLALLVMPDSPTLLFAAAMLWVLDAALNVSMEPFRAFVGDMLDEHQHAIGYSVQTAFIGAGAVVGSIVPWALEHFGVSNAAPPGGLPDTVRYAFWLGGAALFVSVLWTVVTTEEYSPTQMARFAGAASISTGDTDEVAGALAARSHARDVVWVGGGALLVGLVAALGLSRELYLLGALLVGYGLIGLAVTARARRGRTLGSIGQILNDFTRMPVVMRRLATIQFFSWTALFIMWIATTPAVTATFFDAPDAAAPGYQRGANWVDVLFATYNGVAALSALLLLPWLVRRVGVANAYAIGLACGAIGFASYLIIPDYRWLLASEVGIGIAWSAILALPYAMLASNAPRDRLGVYMGLFNVFIVLPQLVVAAVLGSIMQTYHAHNPIMIMGLAASSLIVASYLAAVTLPTEKENLGAWRDAKKSGVGPAPPRKVPGIEPYPGESGLR